MEETELKETITLQVSNGNQIHDPITINNVCRICANQNDKLIGVYTEDGRNNDLANKINTYLPIKVSESDQLPLQCCWECASTVLAWHDLVLTSVEADRRLRNCDYTTLKQVEFEQEHVSGDENVDGIDTPSQEQQNVTESFSTTLNAFCQNEEKQEQICPQFDAVYLVDNPIDNQTEMKTDEKIIIEEEFLNDNKNMYNFSCQYCPLMFITEEEILKHVEDQHNNDVDINTSNNKKNMPAILSKRTKNKLDRELVNAAKVVVDGRIYYNCKQCGKSLHSPYTYVWHMRIHTGERPFVCDLCGKQFRVSQGLVRHLKETHERIRNFPCDLCGRMFATKRNVEEHRRIHTNERPYICDLCGKAFKQKASLFVHNRSHSDLFPFKCSYCAQGFRTKPPLLIHITRHTGEKPYPCDICGRCFRIKYELKRHRLIHSDEKPFSCDECGLSFRQKRYLRNHLKLNHQLCDG